MKSERTLFILKHDAVARGLMGKIMKRLERVGLKLVALEFIKSSEDMGDKHYVATEEWLVKAGGNTLREYKEKGIDPIKELGTDDAKEIGMLVKKWNIEYLSWGPVLATVWEGPGAVKMVRKLVGLTNPSESPVGTIRGDFSIDNAELANKHRRPFYSLVHASGNPDEAEYEIELWFGKSELYDYDISSHKFTGYKGKFVK